MRKTLIGTFFIILFTACSLSADELPSDVQVLLGKRDRAIERINRTLVVELKKLKVIHTRRGDLEGAIVIADLIKTFQVGNDNFETALLRKKLINTTWVWFRSERITFLGNGKALLSPHGTQAFTWRVDSSKKRTIVGERLDLAGRKYKIEFNESYDRGKIYDYGAGQRVTSKVE